jgi:hypothetical protein
VHADKRIRVDQTSAATTDTALERLDAADMIVHANDVYWVLSSQIGEVTVRGTSHSWTQGAEDADERTD